MCHVCGGKVFFCGEPGPFLGCEEEGGLVPHRVPTKTSGACCLRLRRTVARDEAGAKGVSSEQNASWVDARMRRGRAAYAVTIRRQMT